MVLCLCICGVCIKSVCLDTFRLVFCFCGVCLALGEGRPGGNNARQEGTRWRGRRGGGGWRKIEKDRKGIREREKVRIGITEENRLIERERERRIQLERERERKGGIEKYREREEWN